MYPITEREIGKPPLASKITVLFRNSELGKLIEISNLKELYEKSVLTDINTNLLEPSSFFFAKMYVIDVHHKL
jgi:hypothetical protein